MIAAASVIMPPPLLPGDTVAIVSPAGAVAQERVDSAVQVLRQQGWRPVVYPHALGRKGIYSGTAAERFSDLSAALSDPSVKAIFCSRGGYGAVHLLEDLDTIPFEDNPRWLIGFSDISALHALTGKHGLASIHGPMSRHISENGGDNQSASALFNILRTGKVDYTFPADTLDRNGAAEGRLVGGNFAVLQALIGTRFDIFKSGIILLIEDIAEPIYKIERFFYQLKISGVLPKLSGLIVGDFTDCPTDSTFVSMQRMIADMVAEYDYPVAFNIPIGHGEISMPVILNAPATLTVNSCRIRIRQ